MSIPHIPSLYQKVGRGAEGGLIFARTLDLLLTADGFENDYEVVTSSDAAGDYKGVDCILKSRSGNGMKHVGIQYKFFPSTLTPSHRQQIKSSLLKAIAAFPEMDMWWLITPEEFCKSDMDWFATLQREYEVDSLPPFGFMKFSIVHYGQEFITLLMMKHPEIGRQYYDEELFKHEKKKLTLSKVHVDPKQTNWVMVDATTVKQFFDATPSKLIFDFHFLNNADCAYLLYRIDIVVEKVWTEVKGISRSETLQSIGTLKCTMDFNKAVNSIDVTKKPIVFSPHAPVRFGVQLKKFVKNCPGNMAQIHFAFCFDSIIVKSKRYTLSF